MIVILVPMTAGAFIFLLFLNFPELFISLVVFAFILILIAFGISQIAKTHHESANYSEATPISPSVLPETEAKIVEDPRSSAYTTGRIMPKFSAEYIFDIANKRLAKCYVMPLIAKQSDDEIITIDFETTSTGDLSIGSISSVAKVRTSNVELIVSAVKRALTRCRDQYKLQHEAPATEKMSLRAQFSVIQGRFILESASYLQ